MFDTITLGDAVKGFGFAVSFAFLAIRLAKDRRKFPKLDADFLDARFKDSRWRNPEVW